MEQGGSRRDRIGAEYQLGAAQLRAGRQTPSHRVGTRHVAVLAGLQIRRRYDIAADFAHLGGLAEGMARIQGADIGFGDLRQFRELILKPRDRRRPFPPVEPVDQAKGPEILAPQTFFRRDVELLDGLKRHLRDIDLDDPVFRKGTVGQRIGCPACFLVIPGGKRAHVQYDEAAVLQFPDVHLERGGIQRDQNIGCVAGSLDDPGAKINLKRRDAKSRSDRRSNLGGEIRERRQVVAGQCRGIGELATGDLDAVARIAREANDHRIEFLTWFRFVCRRSDC